tara:strand:+ start:9327 stop:10811 length:1485 start_codon:yes stop_codon:yes gene_type:complete
MSKSICGSRYTLNIDKLNLTDFSLSTVDVKSEIKADYLTAERLLTTDTDKKIISSSTTTSEINSLSGVSSNIQTQLNAKQATIADGDLSIARTSGLQTALDTKQATIADGDLSIARTSGLQTALDSKQPTITAGTNLSFNGTTLNATGGSSTITANRVAVSDANGDLTASATTDTEIGFVSGLSSAIQTQLDTKLEQSNFGTGFIKEIGTNNIFLQTSNTVVVSGSNSGIAPTVSAVSTGLALKQDTIADDDLTIARTSGLQTALDAKKNILRIYNTQSLSSPNDNMYKIKNMCVLPLHTELAITSNQGNVYFPNLFDSSNKSILYKNAVVGRAIIDNDVFSIVEPTYNTETTNNQPIQTGTNARFGIKILATGLYKIIYNYNVENETNNNRLGVQIIPIILNTLTNGTEQITHLFHLTSREYMRDDNFGQWCNAGGRGYIEVSSDMLSSSNGVFLKIDVRMIRASGEVYNEGCDSIRINYGGLEIQKIAELAT